MEIIIFIIGTIVIIVLNWEPKSKVPRKNILPGLRDID